MELTFALTEDELVSLDPLYNHKATSELLVQAGEEKAIRHFREQSRCLDAVEKDHLCELQRIFLNSLNRSLYNYVLFTWDLSMSACCFQNKALSHQDFETMEDFWNAGEQIIRNYAACLNFYPAKAVYIKKACAYIEDHLDEELSLAVVARHIFVSSCYLCKIFKPLTGRTFTSYVNHQRLVRAKNMLLTTDQQIDRIAVNCGYRSASYFSTAFRKMNGVTPVEFRNKYRA